MAEKKDAFSFRQCAFGVKNTSEKESSLLSEWLGLDAVEPDKMLAVASDIIKRTLDLTPGDEIFAYPDGTVKTFVDMVTEEGGGVAWLRDWCTKKPAPGEPDCYVICKRSESMIAFMRLNKVKFGIYIIEKYIDINPSKSVVDPGFVFNGHNIADRKKLYAKYELKGEDDDGGSERKEVLEQQ